MNSTIKQYCGFGSGMGNNQDPGSGINIPDPQYCNKVYLILRFLFFSPCCGIVVILEQRMGAAGGLSVLISPWQTALFTSLGLHTDKKENQIFLIYKEIQNGAVAKSCMTYGLII